MKYLVLENGLGSYTGSVFHARMNVGGSPLGRQDVTHTMSVLCFCFSFYN